MSAVGALELDIGESDVAAAAEDCEGYHGREPWTVPRSLAAILGDRDERVRALESSFGYYLRDMGSMPIGQLAGDAETRTGLVAISASRNVIRGATYRSSLCGPSAADRRMSVAAQPSVTRTDASGARSAGGIRLERGPSGGWTRELWPWQLQLVSIAFDRQRCNAGGM